MRNYRIYKFYTPLGYPVEITDLAKFCRENDLSYGSMLHVHNKRAKSHKGWYCDKDYKKKDKVYILFNAKGSPHVIKNLAKFCRENDLTYGAVLNVFNGKAKSHKGWYCRKGGTDKNVKTYLFFNPQHEIVEITNLAKFSRDNELNELCMRRLVSGKLKNHRGWYCNINFKKEEPNNE